MTTVVAASSVGTLKTATRSAPKGSMYCAAVPPGTAASAAACKADTAIGAPAGTTTPFSPFRSLSTAIHSIRRPVAASITRKGTT